jgi:hypothetical protein
VSRLDLGRPRDITALFGDSLRAYGRHFATFIAISAAIVVPVKVAIAGIGLEQLTASYDASPPAVDAILPALVTYLVVSPLLTAAVLHALRALASGERPRAGPALVAGVEAFAPVFFAVVLAALGIAAGLVLIVPGIYLLVRWYFVAPVVVVERVGALAALRRSGELVRGHWWRTLGILLLTNLAAALPALVIAVPFDVLAAEAGREAWSLAGSVLAEALIAPFTVLVATLLFYDLRVRSVSAA